MLLKVHIFSTVHTLQADFFVLHVYFNDKLNIDIKPVRDAAVKKVFITEEILVLTTFDLLCLYKFTLDSV